MQLNSGHSHLSKVCLWAFLSAWCCPLAVAQIVRVDESAFSEDTLSIAFGLARQGAEVGDFFSGYGVRFSGERSVPEADLSVISIGLPPLTDSVVRNVPTEGTSAGKALLIHFSRPAARVGLVLSNGGPATDGSAIDDLRNVPVLELAPGEQLTFLMSEFCSRFDRPPVRICIRDFVNDGAFFGSLGVSSQFPVAVTVIETRDGLPFASFPIGILDNNFF